MPPEPTSNVVACIAASASTLAMAMPGVDYYALIWGLIGALLALYQAERMGRIRSLVFVALSTLVGAACGTAATEFIGSSRPVLIVLSLIAGFGAQVLVTTLLRALLSHVGKLESKT
ncbi:putative holin [Pseudacidovorax intermedius]|uniref:putative holin n=1 Tax=Pseudacidovorax intermedius TaxID=433924 RepID=UPI00034C3100|nr:putative holin [Pseudacidovorax intermedius]